MHGNFSCLQIGFVHSKRSQGMVSSRMGPIASMTTPISYKFAMSSFSNFDLPFHGLKGSILLRHVKICSSIFQMKLLLLLQLQLSQAPWYVLMGFWVCYMAWWCTPYYIPTHMCSLTSHKCCAYHPKLINRYWGIRSCTTHPSTYRHTLFYPLLFSNTFFQKVQHFYGNRGWLGGHQR